MNVDLIEGAAVEGNFAELRAFPAYIHQTNLLQKLMFNGVRHHVIIVFIPVAYWLG